MRSFVGALPLVMLALGLGCAGELDRSASAKKSDNANEPRDTSDTTRLVPPPPPVIAPQLPDVTSMDRDGDRIDDLFFASTTRSPDERERERERERDERVRVEVILSRPLTSSELEAFVHAGGELRHVFRAVSYGFTGTLPRSALAKASAALGSNLLLLKADRQVVLHLDEATRTGRVRPVWAAKFAGSASGFSGSSTINIGFLDTGIDGAHPDLAGRMLGWKDYTAEGVATARDPAGHGSHVAGIAVGSGASFGVGPGMLRFTDHDDLSGLGAGIFYQNPIHLPATAGVLTSTATWTGGGVTDLTIARNTDGDTGLYLFLPGTTTTGGSPVVSTWAGPNLGGTRISTALKQNASNTVGPFAVATTVANYPAVGDGFPALRGVAPLSSWVFGKIFPASGPALTSDVAAAMDDMVVQRTTLNIKVVNMSFGVVGGIDTTQRTKANTMVANGIVVVASNGNLGEGAQTADPGRAASAITVGATNDLNQLTEYTSGGFAASSADEDAKPDILAPGGSLYRSRILSVDSNTADAPNGAFADVQANDYTSNHGTSIAAPFISGSAALVIGALEQSGTVWSFGSTDSPFLVKTLLLASATETNALREVGANPPTLGRSAAPKDLFEGYGIVNPDAAIEAIMLAYDARSISASPTSAPSERRAWGRHVTVAAGQTLTLALSAPKTADYDLYLYAPTPGANGNPVILTAADHPVGEDETLTWVATEKTTAYLFLKRVSGDGAFTLTGCVCAGANESGACLGSAPPCTPFPVEVDAGPPDAGELSDAGAFGEPDADSGAGGDPAPEDDGCSCKTTGAPSQPSPNQANGANGAILLLGGALALLGRRARSRKRP